MQKNALDNLYLAANPSFAVDGCAAFFGAHTDEKTGFPGFLYLTNTMVLHSLSPASTNSLKSAKRALYGSGRVWQALFL